MFSALKKLTRNNERCPAPVPMSSSLQKKFSRGVHYNMKILIKGDRNVGKSCLLQRLQGGPFIEDYVPTDQIQVAPIHWTYKNTDHIVKVEVWEVVDKGKTKKKFPIGLKLENQSAPALEEGYETPILDATFLDVYKNASGVILVLDITKPWTFEYVVKELSSIPADIPVVVLGNHCDMQHHRQVHPHHIEQALHQAKLTRTAPVRYAESSMRNGFGLRLLHKFLSVPFLRLQRTSLLEQLQRNQKDMEEIEKELDDFQMSEESHYNLFVDRMANKRRTNAGVGAAAGVGAERSPSIVLGGGKPIVPHDVNPLVSQSINPLGAIPPSPPGGAEQTQYVNTELLKSRHSFGVETTLKDSGSSPPTVAQASGGVLEEFYAGNLDSSFLVDLAPLSANQDVACETDSEDDTPTNPKVTLYEDDLDIEYAQDARNSVAPGLSRDILQVPMGETSLSRGCEGDSATCASESAHHLHDYPLWAGDSSVRRSPEGGEDPDLVLKETEEKVEKKHKKKKSKDKDKDNGDGADKSERKDKKNKRKKSKGDKCAPNPQLQLLTPSVDDYVYEDYDSL